MCECECVRVYVSYSLYKMHGMPAGRLLWRTACRRVGNPQLLLNINLCITRALKLISKLHAAYTRTHVYIITHSHTHMFIISHTHTDRQSRQTIHVAGGLKQIKCPQFDSPFVVLAFCLNIYERYLNHVTILIFLHIKLNSANEK